MKLACLLFLLFSVGVNAKVQTFQMSAGKKMSVNVLPNWETAEDLFGIPLTVLGPWANESRPVLTILPTGLKKTQMPESDFKKLFEDYKKEKELWVQGHSGKLINFEPATSVSFNKQLAGHYIGSEFEMNNIHFIERSYYLYCQGEVYNLKYSIREEHKQYIKDLQKMVEEFKCE